MSYQPGHNPDDRFGVEGVALPLGRVVGRKAFADTLRRTMDVAHARRWRTWWWCDRDFADWPLGEHAVIESLNRWAQPGRKLYLLAQDYDTMRRLHPRFVVWRQRWDHLLEVRACPATEAEAFPSRVWTPTWCLDRIDTAQGISLCSRQPQVRTGLKQNLDEWWARSSSAFPATTLGL